jgi:hypothetical protein
LSKNVPATSEEKEKEERRKKRKRSNAEVAGDAGGRRDEEKQIRRQGCATEANGEFEDDVWGRGNYHGAACSYFSQAWWRQL